MTDATPADAWIDVARQAHQNLASVVRTLDEEQLARQSACRDWDVAQVLGHLGSAAEIGVATIDAAVQGREPPGPDLSPPVWARWDALDRSAKAHGFLRWGDDLIGRYEALDPTTRIGLRIKMFFRPEPIDLATLVSFRLSELTYHGWDVRVSFDTAATLFPPATELLVDRLGSMIGFFGHADALGGREATIAVETTQPSRSFGLELSDSVRLVDRPRDATTTLRIPLEAWLRLAVGRLAPEHTPKGLTLTGDELDLDDLKRVFPGI
jgi:uncharacterized protein (TIGR03083 family)